jgi:hypothetical protein
VATLEDGERVTYVLDVIRRSISEDIVPGAYTIVF